MEKVSKIKLPNGDIYELSGGSGVESVNDILPENGNIALTQSLIPSDGTAYQMPYYIQTGTIALTTGTQLGVQLTFPTPFKSAPLLLLSIEDRGYDANYRTESVAFNNLSKTGARIRAWYASNTSHDLPCTVHWAAFGELEV